MRIFSLCIYMVCLLVFIPTKAEAEGFFDKFKKDLATAVGGVTQEVNKIVNQESSHTAGNNPNSQSSTTTAPDTTKDSQESSGVTAVKNVIGGVISSIGGAYLDSKTGNGNGSALATLISEATGAWLKSEIVKSWSKNDQSAINKASVNALTNARNGQSIEWNNPDTGATAVITPQATHNETRSVTIIRKKEIDSPPPFDVIGETYVAKKKSNLRSGPSTQNPVVGSLVKGEAFTAVGQIQNKNWVIVGHSGRVVGYVFGTLVQQQAATSSSVQASAMPDSQTGNGDDAIDLDAPLRPAKSTDSVRDELTSDGGIDLDSEGLVVDEATASTACRNTELTVSDSQSEESETSNFKACKAADGAWEIM